MSTCSKGEQRLFNAEIIDADMSQLLSFFLSLHQVTIYSTFTESIHPPLFSFTMSPTTSTTQKSVHFVEGLLYEPTNGSGTHKSTGNAVSEMSTRFDGTAPSEERVPSTTFDDSTPSNLLRDAPTTKRLRSCLKQSSDFPRFGDDQTSKVSQ